MHSRLLVKINLALMCVVLRTVPNASQGFCRNQLSLFSSVSSSLSLNEGLLVSLSHLLITVYFQRQSCVASKSLCGWEVHWRIYYYSKMPTTSFYAVQEILVCVFFCHSHLLNTSNTDSCYSKHFSLSYHLSLGIRIFNSCVIFIV